jgi:hypothetical protein
MRHSFSRFVIALSLSPMAIACGYGDHTNHGDYSSGYTPPASSNVVEQSTIDTGQQIDAKPGAGAGAYIEYATGGTYQITTSCDTAGSQACLWDILVTPLDGASIASVAPNALESDDSLTFGQGNSVNLVAHTGEDFDGFSFVTDPGAAIEVDALLDEAPANRYLFWVGDGALHEGAPSNPIDLVPSAK